ncbi:hypothetical protein L1049_028552 [Liquidambar formosana]|uniref:Uncharacterized protein n=1 Tax=Liquidambar formosana TaxID=63359 RepID=A0AAP0RJV4_LIQFO
MQEFDPLYICIPLEVEKPYTWDFVGEEKQMEIAYHFKNLVVSIVNLMFQLWSISDPPPAAPPRPPSSPPSPALDSEAQVATSVLAQAQQNLNWLKIVLAFCFSSAIDIALQSVQSHPQLPQTFHLLSLAILFSFASLFVAKFICSKFPIAAQVLEQVSVFFAATAFFLAVTIPFPQSLKCTTWAVYAVCVLTILICHRF